MTGTDQLTDAPGEKAPRRAIWFPIVLVAMVVAFTVVVLQRNRIRAHWWAWRIERTSDPVEQARLLQRLATTLPDGEAALLSLLESDSPATRLLAQVPVANLPDELAIPALSRLVHDPDSDVREAAALALAFEQTPAARSALLKATRSGDANMAAAAVYGLARDHDAATACDLSRVLGEHESPLVRAQAAESLVDRIATDASAASEPCDPIQSLLAALDDDGAFDGRLAMEREIADARRFLASNAGAVDVAPPDASTGKRTVGDVVRAWIGDRFEIEVPADRQLTPVERAGIADEIRRALAASPTAPGAAPSDQ